MVKRYNTTPNAIRYRPNRVKDFFVSHVAMIRNMKNETRNDRIPAIIISDARIPPMDPRCLRIGTIPNTNNAGMFREAR